ncbi:Gfo/Idh/MocA family protein [Granulicella mallensis]|uniref:Putative dehydrogenase n=1 Tax=Granulicella mallensis TaxID=940614 RepID=A0A7W8EBU7_9BACT|nr:Gfo/Idh/MocA family oxidoreductase [Granulicella mallensis]MBB5066016.1 putative dehydrogenase [Granulicella mallensis]
MISRREFTGTLAAGAATLAVASSAKSYAQIAGANDRVNFAVIGLNGRAYAHLSALKANQATSRITHVCDVESNILDKFAGATQKELGYAPATAKDFRKVLASKDVDAITIATPDHWHAPMAILGLEAGKHVYVEKPCSYNPHEGELLVAAQKKYGKHAQMGNQQRSSPHTIKIVGDIHNGLIGKAYMASAWYANNRKSIGVGKEVPVPSTLDWELWQGPAPRKPYHDNYQPYNWHWFKHWGTGETLNNGTHEVDVCRWALGAEFPNSVEASGGRYAFSDDWQFYDTLSVNWKYDDKLITWEGRCCNPMKRYDRDRGALIMGTNGSVIVDRDGYEVYNGGGKKTDEFKVSTQKTSSSDLTGKDSMTDAHFGNLIAAIQKGEALHSPVSQGYVAVTMLQLANYAWETNRVLKLDPANGHIVNDPAALALTRREYEKGWEPKL